MKWYILPLFVLGTSLQAQDAKSLFSKELEHMEAKAIPAKEATKGKDESSDVLIITPDARAQDYKQAFDLIRKEKSAVNISFTMKDGSMISNILDMQVMSKGTLIIFKLNTATGINYIVTKVENITALTHS